MEEEEGLRGWTRWWVLVWSGCQRFSSGVEIEASHERQGWEAWVGPNFGLLRLRWVWGSDLELEVERGCQKLLISNEKTNQENGGLKMRAQSVFTDGITWFKRKKTDILDIMETNFRTLSSTYTGINGYALCNQYFVLKIKNFGGKITVTIPIKDILQGEKQ